jgi:hypothetical protein
MEGGARRVAAAIVATRSKQEPNKKIRNAGEKSRDKELRIFAVERADVWI